MCYLRAQKKCLLHRTLSIHAGISLVERESMMYRLSDTGKSGRPGIDRFMCGRLIRVS